ncbi:MAG: THUMP domain-containing protein [Candidatus Aenigmatarchaeota archaeon]|nr:hypothetical protein [Candidatus Aenigmarchaeota archaeon]
MLRQPDCLLVRVGELSLKSPPVQHRMFSMLLDNMRVALKDMEFRFEVMPNRIFVFTKNVRKAAKKLQKVFGIVSISPAWVCHSHLDEIKMLAADVAEKALKLRPSKSFAIRPHRVGVHPFTTRTIAEEAGAAVKRVTGAKVDLSEPDVEIFIESRSRKTYIYSEKIPCGGGLPLGVSGKAFAILDGKEAVVAAWLIMKRGVEMVVFVKPQAASLLTKLKHWHVGRKMQTYAMDDIDNLAEIAQKMKIQAVVSAAKIGKRTATKISEAKLLLLQPTTGWSDKDVQAAMAKIDLDP